jgi:hypothetical protein
MNTTELIRLANEGMSTWKIAEQLGCCQTTVRHHLGKLKVKTKRAVAKTRARVIKFCPGCGKETKYEDSVYCSNKCHQSCKLLSWIEHWLTRTLPSKEETHGRTRSALIHLHGDKCQKCGWCEVNPVTGHVPITMEHKNGDWKDNSPDNVILLCPNCHSLTPTYGALNWGRGREMTNGRCKPLFDMTPSDRKGAETKLAKLVSK